MDMIIVHSPAPGPASIAAPTIDSFSIGAYSPTPSPNLPLSLVSSDAEDGVDVCYLAILPNTEANPVNGDAAAIKAGTLTGAVAYTSAVFALAGNSATIPSGLGAVLYKVAVVIEGAGGFSPVVTYSNAGAGLTIDSTVPVLSSPTAVQTGATTADWGVASDSTGGTIYAGARLDVSGAITSAQLIAGAGGTGVAFSNDASALADASNAGSFSGLTALTDYIVDMVHVDAFGNVSAVVSSAAFTTAAAASGFTDNFNRADETLESSADYSLTGAAQFNAGLGVVSNQLRLIDPTIDSAGHVRLANTEAEASANGTFAMDVGWHASCAYGALYVHFRWTDIENFVRFIIDDSGAWTLEKRVATTFTPLDSGNLGSLRDGTLRPLEINFAGSVIDVNWNSSPLASGNTSGDLDTVTTKTLEIASGGLTNDICYVDSVSVS